MGEYTNDVFLEYASDLLADTDKGLMISEIIRQCNRFSLKMNVKTKYTSVDEVRQLAISKRKVLLQNLSCFDKKQQYLIVYELCKDEYLQKRDDIKELQEIVKNYLKEENL